MFGANINKRSEKSDCAHSINLGPTGLPEQNPHSQQNHTTQNSNFCRSSRDYYSRSTRQHFPCNQCDQYNECQSPGQDHAHHSQPNFSPYTNDRLIFQELLQTQQLLVNIVCKCNKLLCSQQKEINNLNHAVEWLQEKFLAQNANLEVAQLPEIRAESVPPLTSVGMQLLPYFQRDQSEIPPPLRPIIHNNLSQKSSMRTNRPPSNVQQNIFHNTSDLVNHPQNTSSSVYQNYLSLIAQSAQQNGTFSMSSNNGDTTPIVMHHNSNINCNRINDNMINNGAANINQSPLNNKVPPVNRANNYWDIFRR